MGLNGAAARLGMPGDLVIIMAFEYIDVEDDAPTPIPVVVSVDESNRVAVN